MSYYAVGALNIEKRLLEAVEKIKGTIRSEAAKGAAPAAKKSVMPVVVGVGAISLLSLAVALRR